MDSVSSFLWGDIHALSAENSKFPHASFYYHSLIKRNKGSFNMWLILGLRQ